MGDPQLAKYPGLHARSGVWYVRKRRPVDLTHVEPREIIRVSLDTSDKRTAVTRYPFKLAEIELHFENLRAELRLKGRVEAALTVGKLDLLNRREIEELALSWWRDRERVRVPQVRDDDDLADLIALIDEDAARLARPLPGDPDATAAMTDQLLVKAGMVAELRAVGDIQLRTRTPVVNRGSSQYAYLCEIVGRALRLEAPLAKDHLLGRRDAPFDPFFNPHGLHGAGTTPDSPYQRVVSDLIREYRQERETLHGKESTDRKYALLFRIMEEVLGSATPVASIKRSDCVRVLDFLKGLPPNSTKGALGKLTPRQAVEYARANHLPGLAPGTVATYMNNLTAILRWAENDHWGVKPNTKGLINSRHPKTKRRGFTPKELEVLFGGLVAFRNDQPTKFWVPALALFTGARANEICQLCVEDVIDVDGIWCLNLTVFDASGERVPGKRLKTPSSERILPLHPVLVEAGFIEFVERQANQTMLFSDLTSGPKDSYSHGFSKWFGRFKQSVGLNDRALVFHSFRHGFADACRDADLGDDTRRALGGWAAINEATKYGNRGAVPNLDRAMKKISFGHFVLPCGD